MIGPLVTHLQNLRRDQSRCLELGLVVQSDLQQFSYGRWRFQDQSSIRPELTESELIKELLPEDASLSADPLAAHLGPG